MCKLTNIKLAIDALRQHLFIYHMIRPERVQLETDIRLDLGLSLKDFEEMIIALKEQSDLEPMASHAAQLSNVFDLVIHLIFHSTVNDYAVFSTDQEWRNFSETKLLNITKHSE